MKALKIRGWASLGISAAIFLYGSVSDKFFGSWYYVEWVALVVLSALFLSISVTVFFDVRALKQLDEELHMVKVKTGTF